MLSRLEQLQKDNIRNELDAKDINNQAETVKDSANNAHESATRVRCRIVECAVRKVCSFNSFPFWLFQLKNDFKTANESLTAQARQTESARARAQNLLNRASKITVDTNTQLTALQGKLTSSGQYWEIQQILSALFSLFSAMDDIYKSNEREIQTLETELNDLTAKITVYLENIQTSAERYRQCT